MIFIQAITIISYLRLLFRININKVLILKLIQIAMNKVFIIRIKVCIRFRGAKNKHCWSGTNCKTKAVRLAYDGTCLSYRESFEYSSFN